MPAVSSCRSPNSLTCSPRERVTKLLLLSHPCFGFATEPRAMWAAAGEADIRTVVDTARLRPDANTFKTILQTVSA
jgi:hypothetical protein